MVLRICLHSDVNENHNHNEGTRGSLGVMIVSRSTELRKGTGPSFRGGFDAGSRNLEIPRRSLGNYTECVFP